MNRRGWLTFKILPNATIAIWRLPDGGSVAETYALVHERQVLQRAGRDPPIGVFRDPDDHQDPVERYRAVAAQTKPCKRKFMFCSIMTAFKLSALFR